MKLLPLFLILTILLTLSLSGCASLRPQPIGTQELEPSAMLRFSDVPYPAGFKILPEKSFILESGQVRAGVLKYRGRGNAEDVMLFYKTQMPTYNWALLNVLEYGERMLNFERQNEGCVITIKQRGGRVDVSISLAPKSPISGSKQKIEDKELPKVEKRK